MEPDLRNQGYQLIKWNDWASTATPLTTQPPLAGYLQGTAHRGGGGDQATAQGFHVNGDYPRSTYEQEYAIGFPRQENIINAAAPPHLQPHDGPSGGRIAKGPGPEPEQFHHEDSSLPRHSKDKRRPRVSHISIPSSSYFENIDPAMALTYESRNFMQDTSYPQMGMHDPQEQDIQNEQGRYPSPPMPSAEMHPYSNQQLVDAAQEDAMSIENLSNLAANEPRELSPGRSKPIPKPDREVTKNANGKFVCVWAGCTEECREFGRKCEWSKHMDKHDRPYKCPSDGCEKLPGFTYSGGLLRHEREVHNKHGGPRKQLNCPHSTCKRHTGKGFSRQENLNEHLRRVHTTDGTVPEAPETEEEVCDARAGMKRKRGLSGRSGDDDIREELKKLRAENEELRRHSDAQTAQAADMMNQIRQLQASMPEFKQMPAAHM